MVFTDGNPSSLQGILEAFDYFGRISGLQINTNKSEIYFAGRDVYGMLNAAAQTGITRGSLPVRYLGLPLTTKSMTAHDYAPLVDQIKSKLLSWTTKHLSYAGRVQLIKSVIASITNFWCSVFRLPVRCFNEIEQMCGKFLWSGSPNGATTAKISWDDICCLKSEGGLGIRKMRDVSRVFGLNLIWRLLTLSGSLWVSWARRYLLKSVTFWSANITTLGSWIWRKLLNLRDEASPFFRVEIHNGKNTSFWFDNWLPNGRIIDTTGTIGPTTLGIPLHATVAEAAKSTAWKLRTTRSRQHQDLIEQIQSVRLPNSVHGDDVFSWRHDAGNFKRHFSSTKTWHQIRKRHPNQEWSKAIWFSQGIPRCSFISWLTVRNRLSTGSRMKIWGRIQACMLCGDPDETRDHIFFACPYSFTVWSDISGKLLGDHLDPDWSATIHSIIHHSGSRNHNILLLLAFQTTSTIFGGNETCAYITEDKRIQRS